MWRNKKAQGWEGDKRKDFIPQSAQQGQYHCFSRLETLCEKKRKKREKKLVVENIEPEKITQADTEEMLR